MNGGADERGQPYAPPLGPGLFDDVRAPSEHPHEARAWATAGRSEQRPKATQRFFILVSLLVIVMLVAIPFWSSVALLTDAVYSYVLGSRVPLAFALCLIGIAVFYFAVIWLFFSTARPEAQTRQTLVMIGGAIFTVLGISMMLFGQSLSELSVVRVNDIEHNCHFASSTAPLYGESDALYSLRMRPACAKKISVEECHGYRDSRAAQVLKAMELQLRCSTFCNGKKILRALPADSPRTLFSQADYKSSCPTMLVRHLKDHAGDIGDQSYYQGCALVVVSMASGLVQLFGMQSPRPQLGWPKTAGGGNSGGYGAAH